MQISTLKIIPMIFLALTFSSCERPTDLSNVDDGIPPAIPSGLRVYYASDGEVTIEWQYNPEPDLNGYNIFRRTDSTEYHLINFTTSDYYEDDSLEYESTYYYKITAIDLSGKESEPTYEIGAKPINRFIPGKPRFPGINARNWVGVKSIFTNWKKPFDADIAGYNIYRSEDPSFTADSNSFIGFSTTTHFNDTSNSLEFNKRYYFRIRTVDNGGLNSEQSDLLYDEIFKSPEMIYPPDNSSVGYFTNFKIVSLSHPARYKIILQENQYFGEVWSNEFNSDIVNDTINILFDYSYARQNVKYYWRIITFTGDDPNSISPLNNFEIVQ